MVDIPLFSVLLSLTVLHFTVSMSLFYKRRKTFPIRGHAMGLVFLNMVAVFADGMQTMAAGILAVPGGFYCAFPVFIKFPAIYVYALAYLARVWRIWFKYRYSNAKARDEHRRVERMHAEETFASKTAASASGRWATLASASWPGATPASAADGDASGGSNDANFGTHAPDVVVTATDKNSPSSTDVEMSKTLVEAANKDEGLIDTEPSNDENRNLQTSPSIKCVEDASHEMESMASWNSGRIDADDMIGRWFYEKRRFFGQKSLRRIVVGGALALWVLPLSLHFAGGSTISDQETAEQSCDQQNPWPTFSTYAIVGMFIIIIAYTTYRARNIYDGYSIKREVVIVLVGGIMGIALTVVQSVITLFVYRILWFGFINCFIGVCLTWKVYLSYANERLVVSRMRQRARMASRASRKSGSVSKSMSLRTCMGNEFSMAMFVEHLKREFSVENLLFYQAVQRYRTACTGDDVTGPYLFGMSRNRLAAEIYARFMDENGELQVNLSAQLRAPALEAIRQCIPDYSPIDFQHTYYSEALTTPDLGGGAAGGRGTPRHTSHMSSASTNVVPADIFNVCQKEIFSLMEKDSFVRFKILLSKGPEQPPSSAMSKESTTNFDDVTQV